MQPDTNVRSMPSVKVRRDGKRSAAAKARTLDRKAARQTKRNRWR